MEAMSLRQLKASTSVRRFATRKREDDPVAAQPIPMPRELPAEIKAVIEKVLSGFNNKDCALYNSAFGGDAVVIDGMAPYRWTGPNAPARWFADAEKWAHDLGVADENIAYDRVIRADVVGTNAYVVLSAKLSFTLRSRSDSRLGILTFTFAKQGDEWKVGSQAWGRLS